MEAFGPYLGSYLMPNNMIDESTRLLQDAVREILQLRRENEILYAKDRVFEGMLAMLHASSPNQLSSCMEDICGKINKYIDEKRMKEVDPSIFDKVV